MSKTSESEPDLDRMAQQIQKKFKFKNFYNQMNFDAGQGLIITKVIIKLAGSSEGSALFKKRHMEGGALKVMS